MPRSAAHSFYIRPRILVIGGAGYVGSVLTRQLLADGYRVRVLDALFYGSASLASLARKPGFEFMAADTRDAASVADAMRDVDAIVHLGELVGDPACALDPATTVAVNYEATRRIAEQAVEYGIRRFVYPSSCSVYGATDEIVTEESGFNPVSLYAEMKVLAEEAVGRVSEHIETVTLRLATVYGMSPRPRFDLVVNQFAARGFVDGQIEVHGGEQWRPFVHVADVASCIKACLEAPASVVSGRTFNVGSDDQNRTIAEVATLIQEIAPETDVRVESSDDHRNYRVSFGRVRDELGFVPSRDLREGIEEIHRALAAGSPHDYTDAAYSNVASIRAALTMRRDAARSVNAALRLDGELVAAADPTV